MEEVLNKERRYAILKNRLRIKTDILLCKIFFKSLLNVSLKII